MYDIAVIGAGAAGLTAAIFAGQSGARVVALDGAKKLGAKILISGGGRCNVTHDVVTPDGFNGNRNAIAKVLRSFTVEETIDWFASMGVRLKREETGKLFPVSDRAREVLDALVAEARKCGVEIRTSDRVETIEPSFTINDSLQATRVIIATGGRSVPKTGSDGHGYDIARSLGHTVTQTFPALVPLVIEDDHWVRRLSGTSADVELSVRRGRILHRERGAMLLTHFGVSGPVVLDISRHWIAARRDGEPSLVVNFIPGETFDSIDRLLVASARKNPRATVGSALRGSVPERILEQIAPVEPISKLSREVRRTVARDLTEFVLPVSRDRGFDYAEVTAGGVPLSEVDLNTMESRVRPDLYLCGEILDIDGKIGGYNFQWAWASGRLAGLGAAR
ncbi:MAG TPA: NAD(P)/FAD-dependent oxidoreductase [Thermoanaerobaculia bacterium]|nr:NAD(P)/FAD-dependent oxidoreductase [Thermoanaerobaculia bacterium]